MPMYIVNELIIIKNPNKSSNIPIEKKGKVNLGGKST
jgi:hypothetical protein